MELLTGILLIMAIFFVNFLLGKTIGIKANRQRGVNIEVQSVKGVDCVVRDAENF